MLHKALTQTAVGSHALRTGAGAFVGTSTNVSKVSMALGVSMRQAHFKANANASFKNCIKSGGSVRPTKDAAAAAATTTVVVHKSRQQRQFSRTTVHMDASIPASAVAASPAELSADEYHRLADGYIERLLEELEALADERKEVDVEYSAGVLTLALPPAGTYVVNKQPPNRQIWLSSPVSGPKRYDWVVVDAPSGRGAWVYLRDGSGLNELLAEEVGIDIAVLEEAVEG